MSEAPVAAPQAPPTKTADTPDPKAPSKPTDGKTPATPGAPPAGLTAEQKKIWKLNVFGKEVDYDASNEDNLKKSVQRGLAADERFQQAAETEKKMRQFIQMLKESPEKVLFHQSLQNDPEAVIDRLVNFLGPKARPIIEKRMAQWVDEEMMDPKDRELMEHKKKIKEMEESRRTDEQNANNERMKTLTQHYNEAYSKDIAETLDKSGLPKTPFTVRRIAQYLSQLLDRGIEAKASDVVDLVRQDYSLEHNQLYGSLEGEALLSILGDDVTNKVVKAAAELMKTGKMKPLSAKEQPEAEPARKKSKYITPDEFREKMGI